MSKWKIFLVLGLLSTTLVAQTITRDSKGKIKSAPAPVAVPTPPPTQAPPQTQPNIVNLTPAEKQEVTTMQRDVSDAEVQAFSISQQLEKQNQEIQKQAKLLNDKISALRTAHKLAPDAFFNQKDNVFVLPPAPTPEKK